MAAGYRRREGTLEPRAAHAADAAALSTDHERGLEAADARTRLARHGPNRTRPQRRPPYLRLAAAQRIDPLVALLVAAAAISVAIGDTVEGATIAAIVVLNGVLGFRQEAGAERAMRAMSEALPDTALASAAGRR